MDVDKWVGVPGEEAEVDQGVEKEGQGPEDHQVTEACLEAEGKVTSVVCVLTVTYYTYIFFFSRSMTPPRRQRRSRSGSRSD